MPEFPEPLPVETGLVVADADRSAQFYTSVLGFEQVRRVELGEFTHQVGLGEPGRLLWMRSPSGQVVKFYDGGPGSDYCSPTSSPAGPRHHFLTVYVADIDASLGTAEHAGAERISASVTLPNGVRAVSVRDLDGHALELVQRPGAGPAAS